MDEQTVQVNIYVIDALNEADLEQLMATVRQAAGSFAIWERLDRVRLPLADELLPLAEWERGRLFNEQVELRWERNGTNYRAWLTVEAGNLAAEANWGKPEIHEEWVLEERRLYLWGEREPQIGQPLTYEAIPAATAAHPRARMVVATYRDPATYSLRHYRYVRMEREGHP